MYTPTSLNCALDLADAAAVYIMWLSCVNEPVWLLAFNNQKQAMPDGAYQKTTRHVCATRTRTLSPAARISPAKNLANPTSFPATCVGIRYEHSLSCCRECEKGAPRKLGHSCVAAICMKQGVQGFCCFCCGILASADAASKTQNQSAPPQAKALFPCDCAMRPTAANLNIFAKCKRPAHTQSPPLLTLQ